MLLPAATRLKFSAYLLLLSLIRNLGVSPNGVASRRTALRSIWAVHSSVGDRVTPKCTTRREPSSMMKNRNKGRNSESYTGRKSHDQTWETWLRTKLHQF